MTAITLDSVRQALDARGLLPALAWDRAKFQARCPCHDDREPSLVVTEQPGGLVTLHCHAGCTAEGWEPVLRELGLWREFPTEVFPTEGYRGRRNNREHAAALRPTSVGTTSVSDTSVGNPGARALAEGRGRIRVSRTEAARWQDLYEHMLGLIEPVPVRVALPRHAGKSLRTLAEGIELLVGLRAARRGGLGVGEPFTFARSNARRREQSGFGEAWTMLTSEQVGYGLAVLRRHGSIERVDPPDGSDPRLFERRGPLSPPAFWRVSGGQEAER